MSRMAGKQRLRVIIIGGGIAGLALANCLQHAGVDFVLVEKRDRLDPQTGASIGILPNGARLLDQLGCYEDLLEVTASMKTSGSHRHDGSLIGKVSDTLQLMHTRTGYAVVFLDRQILLRILADHIQDTGRVILNKSVQSVEQTPDKAVVKCDDGTSVEGDIVVGADGTYSFVRREMWRHAEQLGQGSKFENDKKAMSAEYMCLFGISSRLSGMESGQTDRTYAKDMSTLSYVGKEGRIFWFVFAKMDQVYHHPHIPRFTPGDADAWVQNHGGLAIRERGVVTVRDLYNSRYTCHLVAIEEAAYQHWSHGRIVCLGDSAHKMTANLGAGASSAIESAAALSNVLVPLSSQPSRPSPASIEDAFRKYQAKRALRVGRAMAFSNALTRVQALKGTREYIYTHYIAPRSEDSAAEAFSNFVIGAEKVDHLPIPKRSMQGTMPFNQRQGWGYEEHKFDRARRALPLLLLTALGLYLKFANIQVNGPNIPALISSRIQSDTVSSLSGKEASYDMLYGIFLLEAIRSINRGTILQLSTFFGILSFYLSHTIIGPLYLFLLYIYSPIENFRASDNRLTDMSYTLTAAPLLLLLHTLPKILIDTSPDLSEPAAWILTRHPYLIGATQFLLAHSIIPRTQPHDRLWNVRRDYPFVRIIIAVLLAVCAVSRVLWLTNLFFNPSPQIDVQELTFGASVLVWLLLSNRDFREAGMSDSSIIWKSIAASVVLGPAMLLGIGWLWREQILVGERHKDAVVEKADEKIRGYVDL